MNQDRVLENQSLKKIFLKGIDGFLECNYHFASSENRKSVLILHPHPQHGGNMHTKVIFNSYKTFANLGFDVLRYNSRGVGKSEGEFSNGEKERLDAISLIEFLFLTHDEVWLVGFSFGSFVAGLAAANFNFNQFSSEKNNILISNKKYIKNLILIAPPVNFYSFNSLINFSEYAENFSIPFNLAMIHGSSDEIVPIEYSKSLHEKISNANFSEIKYADHFFSNHMPEFIFNLEKYIKIFGSS